MTTDNRYVTRSEFAQLRGCSAPYVTKLGHQGRLVLDPTGKLVDVAATLALLDRTDDPARGGGRTKPTADRQAARASAADAADGTTTADSAATASRKRTDGAVVVDAYKAAATRERDAKAGIAMLQLAEMCGVLTRRAEVEAAIFGLCRQAVDALDAIPDRLSAQLAATTDAATVHRLLSAELRHVMDDLAAAKVLPPLPVDASATEPAP